MKINPSDPSAIRELQAGVRNQFEVSGGDRKIRTFEPGVISARGADSVRKAAQQGYQSYAATLARAQGANSARYVPPTQQPSGAESKERIGAKREGPTPSSGPAPSPSGTPAPASGIKDITGPDGVRKGVGDDKLVIDTTDELTGFSGGADRTAPFGDADVKAVQSLYGSTAGERRFNPAYDLDGDGAINTGDLLGVLALAQNGGTPPTPAPAGGDTGSFDDQPFTARDVEAVKGSFGAQAGDRNFNAAYDFDGDGVINTSDLLEVLARVSQGEQESNAA